MRRIACAGIYRSGSTWLFNAVRLSCPRDVVVKVHPPNDEQWDVVVTSHRDLVYTAASLFRMHKLDSLYNWDNCLKELDDCVQFHAFWASRPNCVLDMRYEDMIQSPGDMFDHVRNSIGVKLKDRDEAFHELCSLKPPKIGIDPISNLHWNHITSLDPHDYRPLTRRDVRSIVIRYQNWQKSNGY